MVLLVVVIVVLLVLMLLLLELLSDAAETGSKAGGVHGLGANRSHRLREGQTTAIVSSRPTVPRGACACVTSHPMRRPTYPPSFEPSFHPSSLLGGDMEASGWTDE